jgi:hypothetical protein
MDTLSRSGRVVLTGSYSTGLMISGDIDIEVSREAPYSIADMFRIAQEIHEDTTPFFQSYYVKSDWADPRLGTKYPRGRYIGLKAEANGERWNFDIWFLSEEEAAKRSLRSMDLALRMAPAETRLTILIAKKFCKDNGIKIESQRIYDAILKR